QRPDPRRPVERDHALPEVALDRPGQDRREGRLAVAIEHANAEVVHALEAEDRLRIVALEVVAGDADGIDVRGDVLDRQRGFGDEVLRPGDAFFRRLDALDRRERAAVVAGPALVEVVEAELEAVFEDAGEAHPELAVGPRRAAVAALLEEARAVLQPLDAG